MEEITKKKLLAGGKVAFGAARIGCAYATLAGQGLLGAFLKQHHMMRQAPIIARVSAEGGQKMLMEGLKEWEDAK